MSEIQGNILKNLKSNSQTMSQLNQINAGKKRVYPLTVDYTDINPKFKGDFVFHYPSAMERVQMGIINSALLGGNLNVDVLTGNLTWMISVLEVVTDEKPSWFDVFSEEFEYDILEEVYDKFEVWQNSFRKRGTAKPEGDSEASNSEVPVVGTGQVQGITNGQ